MMGPSWSRRDFLQGAGAAALAGVMTTSAVATAAAAADEAASPDLDHAVRFMGDGLSLTPDQYCYLLTQLVANREFAPDVYGNGGVIAELESRFARHLGKEVAVFLPTGTLANHVALRRLTDGRERVIVQADSHIFNDSGDCAQTLSGLTLIPVADDFNAEAIDRALVESGQGRVRTEVGAISLESPLRRGYNTGHSLEQAREIADLARAKGIGLHLDGARLCMQAAHQGYTPAEFAAPFDTVYVSLYKNFNAAGGAVLAGPKELLEGLYHERRMFGGSPCHVWPMAALAMTFLAGFDQEYRRARLGFQDMMARLQKDRRFVFEEIHRGNNSTWLHLQGVDPQGFIADLGGRGIHLMPPRPQWPGLLMILNPTVARKTGADLAEAFQSAADRHPG